MIAGKKYLAAICGSRYGRKSAENAVRVTTTSGVIAARLRATTRVSAATTTTAKTTPSSQRKCPSFEAIPQRLGNMRLSPRWTCVCAAYTVSRFQRGRPAIQAGTRVAK